MTWLQPANVCVCVCVWWGGEGRGLESLHQIVLTNQKSIRHLNIVFSTDAAPSLKLTSEISRHLYIAVGMSLTSVLYTDTGIKCNVRTEIVL
jgi:hypothetical protein